MDPFFIVPEKCRCIDYQLLKLQEAPEAVPNGELPRHVQLYCDRYLCDRVVPGNRVTVVGIYSIKKSFATTRVSFHFIHFAFPAHLAVIQQLVDYKNAQCCMVYLRTARLPYVICIYLGGAMV